MKKNTTEKQHDLGRKVREPQKKENFIPFGEAVYGSGNLDQYLTVERDGQTKLTLAGYYHTHMREIQNERKLEEATCKRYDNIVRNLIAPVFAEYAMEEMEDLDYVDCWETVKKTAKSAADLDVAFTLVRMLVEYAYQHGDATVSLWGIMTNEQKKFRENHKGGNTKKKGIDAEEQEVERFIQKGIRIARTLPLVTEFKLFIEMMQDMKDYGQALAGLIIFTLGARTSEAVAFQFKHFCEVTPGYWGLQRINVSGPEARESVAGGKTHNAIRLLWVPRFLAKIILDRRESLCKRFPKKTVDDLPIACYGTEFRRMCTQRELNMFMNELFKKVGAKKDTVRSGYDEIIEDENAAMEYERSIVAYLGRHQAITAMVYCGLSEAEICACAGHEQIDTGVQPYDFVNPDTFRALADKLSRRPIVQIFDQMEDCSVVAFDGGQKSFTSDEGVRIVFQTDREKEFCLNAQSIEGNAPLELGKVTNIQITKEVKMALPQCKENRTISIRQALWKEGQKAYQAAKGEIEKSALEAVCAADELEWLDQAEDIDVQVHAPQEQGVSPLPDVQSLLPAVRIPDSARKTLNQPDEASVFSGAKPENQYQEEHLPGGATDHHMPDAGEKVERAEKGAGVKRTIPPVRYAESDKQLYVLDGRGELTQISNEQCKLYNPRSRGKKVVKSKQDAVTLYTYRPDMLALLISKQGGVYRIPAGGLFGESPASENTLFSDVLRDHGILLQDPNMMKAGASLICLMKSGRVIRLSLNKVLGSFPKEGRALIHPNAAKEDEIISACICPAGNDVLLITQNGQALRIADGQFKINRSFSLQPIKGIDLDEGDRAVACVPYTDDGILCITADGYGMMYQGKAAIRPHGRGTMGMAFVKLREGDKVMNVMIPGQAVAILREDGYLCCLETSKFPTRERNSIGVKAMATDRDKYVVAAAPLGIASNPV